MGMGEACISDSCITIANGDSQSMHPQPLFEYTSPAGYCIETLDAMPFRSVDALAMALITTVEGHSIAQIKLFPPAESDAPASDSWSLVGEQISLGNACQGSIKSVKCSAGVTRGGLGLVALYDRDTLDLVPYLGSQSTSVQPVGHAPR